jgi:putative glutamine amidotransferase
LNASESDTPIIGITTYARNEQGSFHLPGNYVDAVLRAGAVPLLVTPIGMDIARVLSVVDGLVFAGGGDIDPQHYGGSHHPTVYMVDRDRDALEMKLARAAVEMRVPTLAICRGAQIINVALGGSLYEHIPDAFGEQVNHRLPPRVPVAHEIQVEMLSLLGSVIGSQRCVAQSWHHQAARRLAAGLRAVAHAPDGVIEAYELPDHPWLLAVQWHPELTAAEDATQQRLFDALCEAIRRRKTSSPMR